jgi:anti-sigma regulatory factor (Ser/Thr protein kinase)
VVAIPCDEVLNDRSLVTGEPVVSIHADLSPSPRAPGQARALVASVLNGASTRMLDADTVHSAQMVASELVMSAVKHACTELHVGICRDKKRLLIAVADSAPLPDESVDLDPLLQEAAANESGRGMLIVATLASDFGWRPREDMPGKIIWAVMDIDPDAHPQLTLV